jgi:8-oxo-dGTP pyrophosphatase MutT (NUDIX family)
LLIQRSADDHWKLHFEFPRGKCDRPIGEDVVHCAKREIKEETGLDVNVLRLLDKFEYLADGGTRKTTCYNFLCTMKDPTQKVKLSKEHEGYKWISQMGEAELLVLPDQQKTLEMVLSKENPISTTPTNDFTKNNQIEEIMRRFENDKT